MLLSTAALKSFSATVTSFSFAKSSYALYEKAEATFTLSGTTYTNPYDPAQVLVDAIVSLPGGGTDTVPCFYYVPVVFSGGNTTENAAAGTWMLRLAPTITGTYSVVLNVTDGGVTTTSSQATFTATSGSNSGFVRLDSANKQFYKFDNGTPYYPNGFVVAYNDGTLATFYNSYLTKMGANGVTWTRYWLADFARQALEWTDSASYWGGWYGGLGVYNQSSSALLDTTLSLCSQQGIYLQLVFQYHGQYSTTVNPEWAPGNGNPGNPYNSVNGGPLTSADQFFTADTAIIQTKKLYRYIVARWSYCTNIFAWELFNEVEFTNGTNTTITSWHDTMSTYVKSIDPNKHIITTSSGGDNTIIPLLSVLPNMDLLQFHDYPSAPVEQAVHSLAQTELTAATPKPVLCGEFGLTGTYPAVAAADIWGDHVRKTFWVGQFTEVPAMFWYWDTYIEAQNLFDIYKPINTFLSGVDIVGETGGNYSSFNFSSNPSIASTVSATGGLNFTSSTQTSFTVAGDGTIAGLGNLSSYLAGSYHSTMTSSASFTVNYQSAGKATINISAVSSPPDVVQILVDGTVAGDSSFSGSGSYSVNVSSGTHTIKFQLTSPDWVNVSSYQFTPVAISKALAYGYTGATKAYGYIYDNSLPEWEDPAGVTPLAGAVINVGPLTAGSYNVDFFDPQAGTAFTTGGTYSTTPNDSILVSVPSFVKDIAFRVYPSPSTTSTIVSNTSSSTGQIYPNPTQGQATLEFYSLSDGKGLVTVVNEMGQVVQEQAITAVVGANTVNLNVSSLPASMYFVKLTGIQVTDNVYKLIKK